jgi:hypothetical protein
MSQTCQQLDRLKSDLTSLSLKSILLRLFETIFNGILWKLGEGMVFDNEGM